MIYIITGCCFCGVKMPKYDSPLGSKRIAGNPLREFDVPDESVTNMVPQRAPEQHVDVNAALAYRQRLLQQQAVEIGMQEPDQDLEFKQEFRSAREAKLAGERLNDGAKRRIEMLVGMTRSTREVEIEGNKFSLQTLRSKEMREAVMAASEFDHTVQSPFEIRRQLLARSLTHVASIEINQFVGSYSLDAKLAFVDDLDHNLCNRLYSEYLLLTKEADNKFSIKTNDDAKEIVADLKK